MVFDLRFNQQAHEEFIQAYEWYEEKRSGLGIQFLASVEKWLQQISENPRYFDVRKSARYREAKIEHFLYMIVYEFFKQKGIVHIAAIYHSSRNPKRKYRKMK